MANFKSIISSIGNNPDKATVERAFQQLRKSSNKEIITASETLYDAVQKRNGLINKLQEEIIRYTTLLDLSAPKIGYNAAAAINSVATALSAGELYGKIWFRKLPLSTHGKITVANLLNEQYSQYIKTPPTLWQRIAAGDFDVLEDIKFDLTDLST